MKDGGQRDIRKGVLRGAKIVAVVVFAVIFLIWSLSPYVIRHYLAEALQQHDIQLDGSSSIRYNPLLSRVSVRDLNLIHDQGKVFRLGHADLELHLHRLLFSDIYINEFELRDLDLHITLDGGAMNVAGFKLGSQDKGAADTQTSRNEQENPDGPRATDINDQVSDSEASEDPFPYSVVGSLLRISNASITVLHEQTPYTFNIDDFSVKALEASVESQVLALGIEGRAFGGNITLMSQVGMNTDKGEVSSQLDVSSIQLQQMHPLVRDQLTQLSGELNVQVSSKVLINGDTLTASLSESGASFQQLSVQLPLDSDNSEVLTNVNIKAYTLEVEALDVSLANERLDQLTGKINTRIDGVGVVGMNEDTLLSLESLVLGPTNFSSGADIPSTSEVSVEQLQLSKLIVSDVVANTPSPLDSHSQEPSKNDLPPMLMVDKTIVDALRYEQEKLYIGDIAISDVRTHIFIAEDKTVSTLSPSLQGGEEKTEVMETEESALLTEAPSEVPAQSPVFKMAIGKLHLKGENNIVFKDESVQPHYKRDLKIDAFELAEIDSESEMLSPFIFKGRSNEYAKIDIAGGVTPFSENVNLKISGDINEMSLPAVSSYIRDSLGFELKSGQLDTALDVNVTNSELGGSVKLNMRGVDMSAADDAMGSMKDQGAIPLNVALGMLKDKRGNIKLSVPMSGSVNDPSFGISSFLLLVTKKAVMSQAKSYLMNTFVPYASVVSIAISAGEFALKLRFEDLVYRAKGVELEGEQLTYAQQFIQLMKDKEKAQIKICGIATPAEVGLTNGEEVSDEGLLSELKALAKQRSENFKRYVVEEGGIESSRMLLCNPDIDFSEKSQPRIKLSI